MKTSETHTYRYTEAYRIKFKYQLLYFWQIRAYFGKLSFDWFSINGCDIRGYLTAFGR